MDKPKDMRLWVDQGNCRQMNPQIFFEEPAPKEAVEACENCPVWKDCQTWAIYNEGWGYWGRTTAKERKRLRSKLRITLGFSKPIATGTPAIKHGTTAGYKGHLKLGQSPPPIEEGGCGCREAWRESVSKNKQAYRERRKG